MKGFKTIEITRSELLDKVEGTLGVCDNCMGQAETGYYVAVLNRWLCPGCYRHFVNTCHRFPEDLRIEMRNYKRIKELFNVKEKEEENQHGE